MFGLLATEDTRLNTPQPYIPEQLPILKNHFLPSLLLSFLICPSIILSNLISIMRYKKSKVHNQINYSGFNFIRLLIEILLTEQTILVKR